MDDRHRKLLRRHVQLRRDLEPRKVLPYMVSVLDPDDEQLIKSKPTRKYEVECFLDILSRRGPRAFPCLLDALKETQPHLADLLQKDEEILEVTSELALERSNSAQLRHELHTTSVSLETEKSKEENIKKELKELKSLHQALLHQSRTEKEKLMFNNKELNDARIVLTRELEAERQESLRYKEKCAELENELEDRTKEIESLNKTLENTLIREKRENLRLENKCKLLEKGLQSRIDNGDITENNSPVNSRKMSEDEMKYREKYKLPRRRTYSEEILTRRTPNNIDSDKENVSQHEVDVNDNVDILYDQCKEMVECMQHNAKLIELEKALDQLTAERDHALEACTTLGEQVKLFKEKTKNKSDKATETMEDPGRCINCTKVQSEYNQLQAEAEKEVSKLKDDLRNIECTQNEMKDKHEREKKSMEATLKKVEELYNSSKQDLANEIKTARNEMAEKHAEELRDMKNAKDELASQVDRDKLTISRLRSDLDKEKDHNRAARKEFETFKKKTSSEKKQLRKKLEEDIKSKSSILKEVETELKELKEGDVKRLEDISMLKTIVREQQDVQEQLKDELKRWQTLPGRVFNYKTDFDRNGIMYSLGTSFNTTRFINPASEKNCRVKVTRSSEDQGNPMDILDPRKCTLNCTADIEHSWWQVDLGENHALFVTHYTLRHGHDNGLSIVRNWNLEGSRDGRNWKVLRKHENDRELKGKGTYPFYTGTWAVEGKVEAMRYFRIYQTGKNSSGRYALYLSGFEIYGVLLELHI